jgi:hypothetical protein
LRAKQLKSWNYRKNAIAWWTNGDWTNPQTQADHLLEAQTVSSAINQHRSAKGMHGKVTAQCLRALRKPMNNAEHNISPVSAGLNQEKGRETGAWAKLEQNPLAKKVGHMSLELAEYHISHETQIRYTAHQVDAVMASDKCSESLGGTELASASAKIITKRVDRILKHAHESLKFHDNNNKNKGKTPGRGTSAAPKKDPLRRVMGGGIRKQKSKKPKKKPLY